MGESPMDANIFDDIDTNNDNKLDKNEVDAYFEKMNGTTPEELWDSEDQDKDGFISWDEFTGPKGTKRIKTRTRLRARAKMKPKENHNFKPGCFISIRIHRIFTWKHLDEVSMMHMTKEFLKHITHSYISIHC